ncbi:hypothetical protein GCM10018966_036570 [Streptomyces yanii]
MAGLRLGPLLRYVDWETGSTATVWVEADRPTTVDVRCADGAAGSSRTFAIAGHHYALVVVTGLTPDSTTAYEVLLDGLRVWPLKDSGFPASTITTPPAPADDTGERPVRISFGSCRWAAPPSGEPDTVGPDALDALAARLAADPGSARPDVLLLLGDQVYADEISKATRRRLAARRDLSEPPGAEVADYEEYTHLYDESWRDPEVRWLLSTVPQLHDLRRSRRRGRLEHQRRLARRCPGDPLVARADRQRAGLVLGLPAPRQSLPHRPGRGPALRRGVCRP